MIPYIHISKAVEDVGTYSMTVLEPQPNDIGVQESGRGKNKREGKLQRQQSKNETDSLLPSFLFLCISPYFSSELWKCSVCVCISKQYIQLRCSFVFFNELCLGHVTLTHLFFCCDAQLEHAPLIPHLNQKAWVSATLASPRKREMRPVRSLDNYARRFYVETLFVPRIFLKNG